MSKKRLGRGLDALLSERKPSTTPENQDSQDKSAATQPAVAGQTEPSSVETGIDIEAITPSPYQPRRQFAEEALQDLANSISRQGLLQPIVVRKKANGGYELIAGERRWRAAKRAGFTTIPAVIRTVSDEQASALALIENMQREDLNAMEEALGLARLRDEFNLTQQEIADSVGKSRAAIANLLRLTNLGSVTRGLLERGALEMGHARALLALDGLTQDQTAAHVVDKSLSVRQTETLIRSLSQEKKPAEPAAPVRQDPDTARLERRITEKVGAPARIKQGAQGTGELIIKYSNLDELDGVLKHLGVDE
jgi:ParB family transcriptional regulator, chromosome partitioning protein